MLDSSNCDAELVFVNDISFQVRRVTFCFLAGGTVRLGPDLFNGDANLFPSVNEGSFDVSPSGK